MILNDTLFNQLMSVDEQNAEIERIKNAPNGEVLFTASTCANHMKAETLLAKSGVQYYEGVNGYVVNYYKGPYTISRNA